MANRSYLYAVDEEPDGVNSVKAAGLSESEYNIPLFYRILASVNARSVPSNIWSGQNAILGDYEAGVEKLSAFLARLSDASLCDAKKAANVIAFLRDEKNRRKHILLECAEIFAMNDEDIEAQNSTLVAELLEIDAEMERGFHLIQNGDDMDLRELDAEYWTNVLYYSQGGEEDEDDEGFSDDTKEKDVIEWAEPKLFTARDTGESVGVFFLHAGKKTALVKIPKDHYQRESKADAEDDEGFSDDTEEKDGIEWAEPKLFTAKDTGESVGVFFLHAGKKTALVKIPETHYQRESKADGEIRDISSWWLELCGEYGKSAGNFEYHAAVQMIAHFPQLLFGEDSDEAEFIVTKELDGREIEMLSEVIREYGDSDKIALGDRMIHFTTIEPDLYRNEETGDEFYGFSLQEGVASALPIRPEDFYGKTDGGEAKFFLVLHDAEDDYDRRFDYDFAIKTLRGDESLVYGEKDGMVVTRALTAEQIQNLINAIRVDAFVQNEKNAQQEEKAEEKPQKRGAIAYWSENLDFIVLPWIFVFAIHSAAQADWGGLPSVFRSALISVLCFFGSFAAASALLFVLKIAFRRRPKVPRFICCALIYLSLVSLVWRELRDLGLVYANRSPITISSFSLGHFLGALLMWKKHFSGATKAESDNKKKEKPRQKNLPLSKRLFRAALISAASVSLLTAALFYLGLKFDTPFGVTLGNLSFYGIMASLALWGFVAVWWALSGAIGGVKEEADSRTPENTDKEKIMEEKPLYTKEQAEKIIAALKKVAKPSVKIKARPAEKPLPLTASKFGGLGWWDLSKPYPAGENGEPLVLLAQINFAEIPHLPDFPETGLLQFYVAADDLYGADFALATRLDQKNFRVVYHEKTDEGITEAQIRALGAKTAADLDDEEYLFPFKKEYALEFSLEESAINPTCAGFEDAVKAAAALFGLLFPKNANALELFDEDTYNSFLPAEPNHRIGGHPFFTQTDPREICEFDTLLFQMDSDFSEEVAGEICWGDAGIANFFISREDLAKRDFSRVLYNWDCY